MDKLEEISAAGKKEAPAARTGDVGTAEARAADTRGEAGVGKAAKAREEVAAEIDVAMPLSASTATASEVSAREELPPPPERLTPPEAKTCS